MLVRVDDFPSGSPKSWHPHIWYEDYKDKCLEWIVPFEENKIDYIFGVSPLLFNDGDIEFLDENIKEGRVVMHGFDHAFETWPSNITTTWSAGGEFSGLDYEDISLKYEKCNSILENIGSYDKTHFIPPFNSFTQTLLDFLSKETEVKTLHGEKEFFNKYLANLDIIFPDNIDFIMPEDGKDYANIETVISNINIIEHPTLHWQFDYYLGNIGKYETFAKMLKDLK
jgi:hypothetical protein